MQRAEVSQIEKKPSTGIGIFKVIRMNLRIKTYMKKTEFKARQLWLPFQDAVGIALEIMVDVKEKAWAWFKKWKRQPMKVKPVNLSLPLPFTLADMLSYEP